MTAIDKFVEAIRTKRPLSRVRGCYGRIVRTRHDKPLSLTEELDRRVVMVMGPGALATLIGKSEYEMLSLIGYTDDYIRRKLAEGYLFKLVVFSRPAGSLKIANWKNTIGGIIDAYPEIADIVAANGKAVASTSLEEFERQAGFKLADVDTLGIDDPRFMTVERLLASDRGPLATRRFLYHVTRLSELYTGNGMTKTAQGGLGLRENIMRNRPISELDNVQTVELPIELSSLLEQPDSPSEPD